MARSISSGEATPSSTMRIASSASAMPRREVANPGASRTTTTSLPSRAPTARQAVTTIGSVRSPWTISRSFITWTGLKKCRPITRPGCPSSPRRPPGPAARPARAEPSHVPEVDAPPLPGGILQHLVQPLQELRPHLCHRGLAADPRARSGDHRFHLLGGGERSDPGCVREQRGGLLRQLFPGGRQGRLEVLRLLRAERSLVDELLHQRLEHLLPLVGVLPELVEEDGPVSLRADAFRRFPGVLPEPPI